MSSTTLAALVVDAGDPARLARFWAGLLGWQVTESNAEEATVRAPPTDGCGLELVFVRVGDPRPARNRIHLDLSASSAPDQARRVALARELGGRPIDIGQVGVPWEVMADPEGNEFCVRESNPRFRGTGAVAAILVDAADPAGLAAFWAEASGWAMSSHTVGCVSLRALGGRGPWLEFWPSDEPKRGKNRLHLDVAAPGADHRAEAERLVSRGARPTDIGQADVPWVVLEDPEGNEFCVLEPR